MGRDYAGWGVLPKFADGHGHFMKVDCAASYHVAAADAGDLAEPRAEPCGDGARSGAGATLVKHIASASASPPRLDKILANCEPPRPAS